MLEQQIAQKVVEIVSGQLELDPTMVTEEAAFDDDLKADSLAVVEIVLAFEEAFGIEIPDEDAQSIRTVKDAIRYIQQRHG